MKKTRDEKRNPWTTLKTKEVYKNPWIRVTERQVLNPSGGRGIYGVVHFQNTAVGVLAIDEKDRVLLVGQFRYAIEAYSWEIPEGGCPLGTSPLRAAKRELREETGYTAKSWSKLQTLHLSNSCSDEVAMIYLARTLTPGLAQPEETEQLKTKWVSFQSALRFVETGQITDAITVAALLRAALIKRR